MKTVLRVDGLRQNYGGVQALRGVSFELQAGECVALIGPNGAGKSTCFACLAGQQKALAGSLVWRGHDLQQSTVEMRTRLGVARTFQVAQVFEALTVLQNLQLVLQASRGVSMRDLLDECLLDEARHWIFKAGLNDMGEEMLYFNVKAKEVIGIGKFDFKATGGSHSASYAVEMNIRPANPSITKIYDGNVDAGSSWSESFESFGDVRQVRVVLLFRQRMQKNKQRFGICLRKLLFPFRHCPERQERA